jgi:hypothetical protein
MTTYTVTIARTVYETVNVEVTAENEAAAIEKAKQLFSEEGGPAMEFRCR